MASGLAVSDVLLNMATNITNNIDECGDHGNDCAMLIRAPTDGITVVCVRLQDDSVGCGEVVIADLLTQKPLPGKNPSEPP